MTPPPAATVEREATVWYVYGVVPADEVTPELFERVGAVGGTEAVGTIRGDSLAAIVSPVPSAEFGDSLQERLADPAWLEQKVRAHAAVLDAAVGRIPLVPLRFGAVYRSEEHVRRMLAEHRELAETLERVRGAVELGIKAFLDSERFRASRIDESAADDEAASAGRAYLVRKQHERQLSEAERAFKTACARASHDGLAAAAEAARANPPHRPEVAGRPDEMFLNGAYLVRVDRQASFTAALAELQRVYGPAGVRYEVTGPWPPYNFVDDDVS